jgi:hypothetical protein
VCLTEVIETAKDEGVGKDGLNNTWTDIASAGESCDWMNPVAEYIFVFSPAAERAREDFVRKFRGKPLSLNRKPPFSMVEVEVDRSTIFSDTMQLYSASSTDLVNSFPFLVKFKGEGAVDFGGVGRDFFSAFWEEVYVKMFDGSALLAPASHAGIKMNDFAVLGRVLSHGYLCCGFLPTRIAFPVLACALLGPSVSLSTDIYVQSFSDYLSTVDYNTISHALKVDIFSTDVRTSIINIISRFDSREVPTPNNLRHILSSLSEHHFKSLPYAAISTMNGAIPDLHKPFWQNIGAEQFYDLVNSVVASPSKVLQVLSEPIFQNSNEKRVFMYLEQFIGQMTRNEVNRFLRYVTGYSILTGKCISVTFNALSGIARRPIAHTCDSILEVPNTYATYLDFVQEFSCLLNGNEYCWAMDCM